MVVQQTSLEAFQSISDSLGEEQLRILNIFRSNPQHKFTDEELSILSCKHINCVTPRRGELEKNGYIIRCDKIIVQRGNVRRSVYTWMLS
jgi:hypothetical protein